MVDGILVQEVGDGLMGDVVNGVGSSSSVIGIGVPVVMYRFVS